MTSIAVPYPDLWVPKKPAILRPWEDTLDLLKKGRKLILDGQWRPRQRIQFEGPQERGLPSLEVLTSVGSGGHAGTVHTYNSVSFGAEHPSRILLVTANIGIVATGDLPFQSVTIDGQAMTAVIPGFTHDISGSQQGGGLWAIRKPTGTSGTVVVTLNSDNANSAFQIMRLLNVINMTPFNTDTDTAGTQNLNINVPARGIAVAVASGSGWAGTTGWAFTGLTEVAEQNNVGSSWGSVAVNTFLAEQSALAVTATPNSTVTRAVSQVASWA